MEILLWVLVIWFLTYMTIENRNNAKERVLLIRELSIASKSKTVDEYVEKLPNIEDDKIELPPDELVDISEIDPWILLRSLSK